MRRVIATVCACWMAVTGAVPSASGAQIVSPRNGETVRLLPEAQREILALPTMKARSQGLKRYAEAREDVWNQAKPLELRWRPGPGDRSWEVLLGKRADLSDARRLYAPDSLTPLATNAEGSIVFTLPKANLEIGTTYYWRVTSNFMCGKWGHIRGQCGCTNVVERHSETVSFVTEDLAPRWIDTEGRVDNIRDCGGYRTLDGRRVRQGLVFRGQGLNESSATGERPGRCKMTVEDRRYLVETLRIRTDLDLRLPLETGQMTVSPLGPSVRYVQRTSECYRGIFTRHGKKAMAENFREFCDRANYPIYFHCRDGADRTGALAYVLNGILGVSRHDLETDWESTFYPWFPDDVPDKAYWRRMSHLVDGFSKYGTSGDSWNRRIELYLLDCGVTAAEIDAVREILLER